MYKFGSKQVFPLIIIAVITIYSLFPLVSHFKTSIVDRADGLLIVWILNQTIQKIPHDLVHVFEGNMFYTNIHVLAFSVLLIPSAILSAVPVWLTGEPIVAYNFALVFAQFATMSIVYLWWHSVTKNSISSLLGSIVFGLSQIRMHYRAHLQVFNLTWILGAGFMFWMFGQTKKKIFIFIRDTFGYPSLGES